MGRAIRDKFTILYGTYDDAQKRSATDIENMFRTHSAEGIQVVKQAVETFTELCKLAEFNSASETEVPTDDPPDSGGQGELEPTPEVSVVRGGTKAVVINVNVQLALPETTDQKVYDALFESLNRHILS